MARDVVFGGEGKALIGGVDMEVSSFSITPSTDKQDISCTSDYDPIDQVVYKTSVVTGRMVTIEITWWLDRNNYPTDTFKEGDRKSCVFTVFGSRTYSGTFECTSLAIKVDDVKGVTQCTASFESQGKYTVT